MMTIVDFTVPTTAASATTAVQVWTLIVAVLAVVATVSSAFLLRRTGKGTVAAAHRAAEASERSARAAQDAVNANREAAAMIADRADADALAKRREEAIAQLGHDAPAVRLAGVYAMADLADNWEQLRQSCVNILCAYLRLPDGSDGSASKKTGEQEVRAAILSLIVERYGVYAPHGGWRGTRLDLHGLTLRDFSFRKMHFDAPISLREVRFTGRCVFEDCRFNGGMDMRNWSVQSGSLSFELPTTSGSASVNLAGGHVYGDSSFQSTFRMDKGDHGFAIDLSHLTIEGGKFDMNVPRLQKARSVDLAHLTILAGSEVHFRVEERFGYSPGEYEWMNVRDSPYLDPRTELWNIEKGAQIRINPGLFRQQGWPLRPS